MARPRIQIDWETVNSLCEIQCTAEEIAQVLRIDADTLATACKREHKLSFSDYFELKRGSGRASLRRSQWLTATQLGNPTMQIWLGKQYLGQKDKSAHELSGKDGGAIEHKDVTKMAGPEIDAEIAPLLEKLKPIQPKEEG